MTLRYVARLEEDEEYYINKNYRLNDIKRHLDDIAKAKQLLSNYENRLMTQYNQATMLVGYTKIIATRIREQYKDKKVYINVRVCTDYKLNAQTVYTDIAYGYSKSFSYKDKNEAMLYIYSLIEKFPGCKYINETPYKFMEV